MRMLLHARTGLRIPYNFSNYIFITLYLLSILMNFINDGVEGVGHESLQTFRYYVLMSPLPIIPC
jgi:hypothetical protein